MDYLPSKNSIKFMSKLNWDELVPYMEKIYGKEYGKNLWEGIYKKICKAAKRKLE